MINYLDNLAEFQICRHFFLFNKSVKISMSSAILNIPIC